MQIPFVPLRKPGKLPAARLPIEHALEYGYSQLDIHEDALAVGKRAYIVDDLLATGGTAAAATKLVELAGGEVVGLGFVIELEELGARAKLDGLRRHEHRPLLGAAVFLACRASSLAPSLGFR